MLWLSLRRVRAKDPRQTARALDKSCLSVGLSQLKAIQRAFRLGAYTASGFVQIRLQASYKYGFRLRTNTASGFLQIRLQAWRINGFRLLTYTTSGFAQIGLLYGKIKC